eukprot:TRINITY_DN256_c1_g2_i1.p2 TRINITY_DN256_c1_g2~~TRINITY_DN256_c1_g2_i1.p2  ORF type:complete len:294 (-),score=80.31 TRINITY_DN256_c1_g2_i1:108-902(-)
MPNDDASSDDGGSVDFDDLADAAITSAGLRPKAGDSKAVRVPKELRLEVGLGEESLYLRRRRARGGLARSFNTAVPAGVNRLTVDDFEDGLAPEPPAPSAASDGSAAREIRGAPVRPVDDSKLKKKEAKALRDSKLDQWYGLKKQQLTPELEKELRAIKLRANVDPKRFYKGNDSKELPKYFAMATEIPGGMRPAGERATREPRPGSGRTFLGSILGDEKVQEWTRGKWGEVGARGQASVFSGHGKRKGKGTKRGGSWKKQKRS